MKYAHPVHIPVAELGCTKTMPQACSRQAQVLLHLSCSHSLVMCLHGVCSCLPVLSLFFAFSPLLFCMMYVSMFSLSFPHCVLSFCCLWWLYMLSFVDVWACYAVMQSLSHAGHPIVHSCTYSVMPSCSCAVIQSCSHAILCLVCCQLQSLPCTVVPCCTLQYQAAHMCFQHLLLTLPGFFTEV